MEILVGELAKLYGLSSQTLHYYEEKGVLNPNRSLTNGYRYYEASDISRLGSIKKYRNAEFSLPEGVFLFEEADDWDIATYYQKQKEKIRKEIERKQHLMIQIDDDLSLYNRYQRIGNRFIEEELDGFMRFESLRAERIFQNNKKSKEATPWFKNILYTFASYMYYIDENITEVKEITYGMVCSNLMAKYLELEKTRSVINIHKGLFLTSVMNTDVDGSLEEYINKCLTYVKENNYELRGNPFCRTIFLFTNSERNRKSYNFFYITIKKYIL